VLERSAFDNKPKCSLENEIFVRFVTSWRPLGKWLFPFRFISAGETPMHQFGAETSDDKQDTERLLADVKRGQEAMNELLSWLRPRLRQQGEQLCTGTLGAKEGVSDIVQDAMQNVFVNFRQFHGGTEEEFLAWTRTIFSRVWIDVQRYWYSRIRDFSREQALQQASDSSTAEELLTDDQNPTPSSVASRNEEIDRLLAMVDELPDRQRLVVLLRKMFNHSWPELGMLMFRPHEAENPAEAARQLFNRAKQQLSEKLN
jgi:RNA polymerase sigma-70 factor, ECF subfamily